MGLCMCYGIIVGEGKHAYGEARATFLKEKVEPEHAKAQPESTQPKAEIN